MSLNSKKTDNDIEEDSMKKKRIKIVVKVLLIILLIVILRWPVINGINEIIIEKTVTKKYPEYEIIDKKYTYSDFLFHNHHDIENDDFYKEIYCNTTLRNKKTGMYVTIPFKHSRFGLFKDDMYDYKDIKQLVNTYEKYWNEVNDFSKKNGIEVYLSNVEITTASNCDISDLIIYIKEDKSKDIEEFIKSIDKIDFNLRLLSSSDIHYVVANEKTFEKFRPWFQSNIFKLTFNYGIIEPTEDEQNYDFYYVFDVRQKRITMA